MIQYLPFHSTTIIYLYIYTCITLCLQCDDVHQSEFVERGEDVGYEATAMGGRIQDLLVFVSGLYYTTTTVLT